MVIGNVSRPEYVARDGLMGIIDRGGWRGFTVQMY
jgi:hypothetical protein